METKAFNFGLIIFICGLIMTSCQKENLELVDLNHNETLIPSNQIPLMDKYQVTNFKNITKNCIDAKKIQENKVCIRIYNPVCGCNGITYRNQCEAEKAGVVSFNRGQCQESQNDPLVRESAIQKTEDRIIRNCIDESKIDLEKPCPEDWEPVCGCNNKTYGNTCEAKRSGIKNWTQGECN